jgi:hypothetical protein
MTWNTLDIPLGTGWQCTLIPGPQYCDLMRWGRGYREMSARGLYPNAGRDNSAWSWNARPLSDVDKSEWWEKDRLTQLADDRAAFARHFRPDWDLRSITGEKALRDVQAFVRDRLNVAHWNQPTGNAGIRKLFLDAVVSGQLVPVVNREYRGVPRVTQRDPAPEHWPASGGGGDYAYKPKVLTGSEFLALKRANGELPEIDSFAGGSVSATLNPLPDLGTPARSDDDPDWLGVVESAAGALPGGGDDDSDGGDDTPDLVESMADDSTPLGDAQPFVYSENMPDGDVEELATTTNNPRFAAKMLGYDYKTFGTMLHKFKDANGLGPADNSIFHDNGDVEFNGQIFEDSIHDYAR